MVYFKPDNEASLHSTNSFPKTGRVRTGVSVRTISSLSKLACCCSVHTGHSSRTNTTFVPTWPEILFIYSWLFRRVVQPKRHHHNFITSISRLKDHPRYFRLSMRNTDRSVSFLAISSNCTHDSLIPTGVIQFDELRLMLNFNSLVQLLYPTTNPSTL